VLVDDDPASEMPLRQLRVCLLLFDRPHSMSELSRELGVSQSAITQIADRLEAARMVTRGEVGDDRRVRRVQLTPRAQKMMRLREESRIERIADFLRSMTAEHRSDVLAALEALREAANSPEP
jgi:DNA-binding MarR family transcriptional regulator